MYLKGTHENKLKTSKHCRFWSEFSGLCHIVGFLFVFTLPVFKLHSQPVVSTDAILSFEIDARARNGNTGFEGVLFTPSTPASGQPGGGLWQMDPQGAPVWNSNGNVYGDMHAFLLTYEKVTGKTIWNIDFNRDGDFDDAKESVSNIDTTLSGKGFKYINLWVQGNAVGLMASITDFTINGSNLGNFSSNSETAQSMLYTETQGYFTDVTISGKLSFSGNGGQERPRVWVRLGQTVDDTSGNENPVKVPVFSNLSIIVLLSLFLLVGGFFLYQNRK